MAQIANPKKAFNFNIFAAGLNPYAAQKVSIPDFEIEVVEHGDTNHDIKTAGKIKYGAITVEKLRPIGQGDNWIWHWIQSIQNVLSGGGLLPLQYKRTIDIVQYSTDNQTVTDLWECQGVWPSKVNGMELSRMSSDNILEVVELQVDRVIKRR